MKSLTILPAFLLAVFLASDARAAVTLTTLHSFTGPEGANPVGLLQGSDGNFYGTTEYGGNLAAGTNDEGKGTIFKMSADGTITTLHSFAGDDDGGWPEAGLVQGRDGTFFGTTTGDGFVGYGTMFSITPSGQYSSLTPFGAGAPTAGLVLGRDNKFYGTALFGGEYSQGTLFTVTPEGSVSVFFSFDGTNGYDPNTLVAAGDGNFYGTTAWGGPRFATGGAGYGTFFKLTPDGSHTFLYWFHNTNGSWPTALIESSDGNFYGTTAIGGPISSGFSGTFFKITRDGEHTMLASFSGTNGFEPRSLMRSTDGNFYGTTRGGTANAKKGTIFRATPDGVLTSLFSFNGTNGASPLSAPLVQTAEDTFYGTTYSGGASNLGTVFRIQITPGPPMLKSVSQIGGGFTFAWAALTGRSYQVQFNTNLTTTNWVDLGDPVMATNTTASANDVIGPDRQRFYRVVLLP